MSRNLCKNIENLVEEYKNQKIDKFQYMGKYASFVEILYYFSNTLKNSLFKEIRLVNDEIVFTTSSNIKITTNQFDQLGVPVHILSTGCYEDDEILFPLLEADAVIFDIGANIGWHTVHFAKLCRRAQIFAFEPIHDLFAQLRTNIALNTTDSSVFAHNIGLSDSEGEAVFYYLPRLGSLSGLKNLTNQPETQKISVPTTTIDQFCVENKISKLDFIKCDAEGAELKIVMGGLNSIEKLQPILMLELYAGWSGLEYSPADVMELLSSLNYLTFLGLGDNFKQIFDYEEDAKALNEDFYNFFFLHRSKHLPIIERILN